MRLRAIVALTIAVVLLGVLGVRPDRQRGQSAMDPSVMMQPATMPGAVDGAVAPGVAAAAATDGAASNGLLALLQPAYAALSSYADEGIIIEEMTGFTHQYTFRTHYRAPADFHFDFSGVAADYGTGVTIPLDTRIVLWMFAGELEAWYSQLRTHEIYRAGESDQTAPLNTAAAHTAGAATLIPSLLFSQAALLGLLQETVSFEEAGEELVDGHRCRKLVGIAQSAYPSGQIFNVRPVTFWIDAETGLLRKAFQDTPRAYPAGEYHRITYTIEPRMNPALDDASFRFDVPAEP